MISVIISPASSGFSEVFRDLQEQTYRDFEVLIAGPSRLSAIDLPGQDVRFVEAPIPTTSRAGWLNEALNWVRGEYVLAIDSDDRLSPNALALLAAAGDRASPRLAAIVPGIEVMGSIGRTKRSGWTYLPSEAAGKLDLIITPPSGPLLFRSEAVRSAGGWPTNYPSEGSLYPNLALLFELLPDRGFTCLPEAVLRLPREKVTTSPEALACWPILKFLTARAAGAMGRLSEIRFDNKQERTTRSAREDRRPGPLVTVVMSVHNAEDYVGIALESSLIQTYSNVEILVVDDGSSDRTAEIVRSHSENRNLGSERQHSGHRIRLIERARNSGKASCLNLALEQAHGEYLLELDGDDWLDPDAVESYVDAMLKAGPDVACVHGPRRAFSSCGPGDLRFQTIYPGRPIEDKYDFARRPEALGPRFCRTACLRSIGGWPSDYLSGGTLYEDLALLFRLADRYRFGYVDGMYYNIRLRPDSVTARHHQECWPILKDLVRQALARWGKKYTPEFDDDTYGIRLRRAVAPPNTSGPFPPEPI